MRDGSQGWGDGDGGWPVRHPRGDRSRLGSSSAGHGDGADRRRLRRGDGGGASRDRTGAAHLLGVGTGGGQRRPLEQAAAAVPRQPHLRIVAGFERPIVEWPQVLAGLAGALPQLRCDLVVVDLGVPFTARGGRCAAAGPALGAVFDAGGARAPLGRGPSGAEHPPPRGLPLPRTRVVLMRPQGERGRRPASCCAARCRGSPSPWSGGWIGGRCSPPRCRTARSGATAGCSSRLGWRARSGWLRGAVGGRASFPWRRRHAATAVTEEVA